MAKKAASKTVVANRVAKSKPDPTKSTKALLPKKDQAKLKNSSVKSQPISPEQVRAWWSFRQGLDQVRSELTAEQVLERYGWARSVAGAGPYLTLFTRAGIKRQAADDALAKLKIHELPSVRGCTYVLPASDYALGLKVGEQFGFPQEMRVAEKLGVTTREVYRLCDAVLKALSKNPLEPEEIRIAIGSAARNLGEVGKKKGMITTLPLALGKLQSLGQIRRIPSNGRLDQQRYRYAGWKNNPLEKFKLNLDQSFVELARRYFRWIGPASLAEFRGFSALGVKSAEQAIAPLGLVPISLGDSRLMFADDLDALRSIRIPKDPDYKLVSGLDSILSLRREVAGLVDAGDASRIVLGDREKTGLGTLNDLSDHAIFDRGRLVGLWLFDPASHRIISISWIKPNNLLKAAIAKTEQFIQSELGDARLFSLDSPKSRAPRIDFFRKFGK